MSSLNGSIYSPFSGFYSAIGSLIGTLLPMSASENSAECNSENGSKRKINEIIIIFITF